MRKQLISWRKNTIKKSRKCVLSSWNFHVTISSDILMKYCSILGENCPIIDDFTVISSAIYLEIAPLL